ncbi:O-antigen ligase like membrane protein [Leeuwenhoekiella marinoflava DSM 3653]|uniref:O-antigen ligase-like membrane protein n=3 Tax=Leeuwenhoekiella marinoflava TaxID=988 RepID=A0A4Q0PGA4_9FLAO|nr:O-antigen ligase-like membrane protein [Leeuwenhoekiella marinoflava]SHF75416.1 O-antigen ligase like membrane protein [Leeuwenhoekiella marinoflava DSM 3653]
MQGRMSLKSRIERVMLLFSFFVVGSLSAGAGTLMILALTPFVKYLKKYIWRDEVVRITLYLFLVTAFFSFFSTFFTDPFEYVSEILKQLSWIVLAIISLKMSGRENTLFFKIFLVSIVLCLPLVVLLPIRFQAYFPHANHLAYYCLLPLVYFLLTTTGLTRRLWVAFLLIIVVVTKSSGGLATFMMTILLFYIIDKKISLKLILQLGSSVALLLLVAHLSGALDAFIDKVTVVDFEKISKKADRYSFGSDGSLVWRMTYWLAIFREFSENSGTMQLFFGEGLKTLSHGNYIYSFMVNDPHNDYLRLLVERGIVGAIVYVCFLIKLCLVARQKYLFLLILFVPMFFGNVIVSFPYVFTFIFLISYFNKSHKSINHGE